MILKDRYIHVENEAYFPSDDPDKDGNLHKDWGIISYSGDIHIREFNSEGFIIHYVQMFRICQPVPPTAWSSIPVTSRMALRDYRLALLSSVLLTGKVKHSRNISKWLFQEKNLGPTYSAAGLDKYSKKVGAGMLG